MYFGIITTKQPQKKCDIPTEMPMKFINLLVFLLAMLGHISLKSYRRFWNLQRKCRGHFPLAFFYRKWSLNIQWNG